MRSCTVSTQVAGIDARDCDNSDGGGHEREKRKDHHRAEKDIKIHGGGR